MESRTTQRIKRLEARLREVENRLERDIQDVTQSLAAVDSELWTEANGVVEREVANAVLEELEHWRRQVQRWDLVDSSNEAVEVLRDLKGRTVESWHATVVEFIKNADPEGCFQHLQQTTTIHLELLEATQGTEANDEGLAYFRKLRETETLLKRAFIDVVARTPPNHAARLGWGRDLADRAGMILTAVDQLTPEQASAQLGVVAEDIKWHLKHIETNRGRLRSRLRRRFSRLRAERQERELQNAMESRFGVKRVARMERLVLLLIVLVIALMAFEFALARPLSKLTAKNDGGVSEREVFELVSHGFGNPAIAEHLDCTTDQVAAARANIANEMGFLKDARLTAYAVRFRSIVLWISIIDACACFVFLLEFFTKLKMVKARWLWFRRHVLIDLVPSIPVGLLAHGLTAVSGADALRAGRLARLVRLSRLARYIRLLNPILRMVRGFGLLARGLDRLARRYGHVLNHNVILYPTRDELEKAEQLLFSDRALINRLRREVRDEWTEIGDETDPENRKIVGHARLQVLRGVLNTMEISGAQWPDARQKSVREIPAQTLIEKFETLTPQEVECSLGDELIGHLSQNIRTFSRPPIRWLPIVSSCVPALTPEMSDAEVVTTAAHQVASVMKRYHDAYFWVADLYGTVTPSQFVDRVGQMLVKSSSRPAYRLLMFGGFYGLVHLLLQLDVFSLLLPVREFLGRYVGLTVAVVGSVCIVILLIGNWLKNLAQEATEFYERSASAQFLSLTELFRSRHLHRDAELLYDRVLRPEWELHSSVSGDQSEPRSIDGREPPTPAEVRVAALDAANNEIRIQHLDSFFERVLESIIEADVSRRQQTDLPGVDTVSLLYRDCLNGSMFTDQDTRTTSQLLGNPAVLQFQKLSGRLDKKQIKGFSKLDLTRQKSLFNGPYIWFNFVSRSIAHSVACLMVDYNRNAIPLDELERVSPGHHNRYQNWLAGEGPSSDAEQVVDDGDPDEQNYVTTAFNSLHFLDDDQHRDQDVEARFGSAVLSRLVTDRTMLIRRIFGTFPLHDRPKDQRVVNLFTFYSSWFSGGRALLIPLSLMGELFKFVMKLFVWVASSVQEIRKPKLRKGNKDAAKAHFNSAVRKIMRIRGPVVLASLRLRMMVDPEFLGVPLPGQNRTSIEDSQIDVDLEFLRLNPAFQLEVERERERCVADMRRLRHLLDGGLLEQAAAAVNLPKDAFDSAEHLRAATISYVGDLNGVRVRLSCVDILEQVFEDASKRPPLPGGVLPRWLLKRKFNRYWAEHGTDEKSKRKRAWRAVLNNVWQCKDALLLWANDAETAREDGVKRMGELMLHPRRLSEQLVSVRTIQSLAVLDVLNYREHVYNVGRYSEMGDKAGNTLSWKTSGIGQD